MKKHVVVYGIIAGLIVSVLMGTTMLITHDNPNAFMGPIGMVIGYTWMLIAFSLIFVAIKNYRDKHNGGLVSFGKAFRIGFLISLIASTLYVITWALEYHFFIPDFPEMYTAHVLATEKANGATEQQLAAKAAEMAVQWEWYKNPFFFALLTYSEILPVGIVVSIISALVLKRHKKERAASVA